MSKKDLEEKLSVERDIFKKTLREERERSEKLSQKVHDLQLEIIKINNIKTTNDQELIKRINELENKLADATKKIKKTKEDYTSIKKERNIVMKKTRILEDTIKETYVELDKQVQLKEKYQEEKKSTYRDH